MNTTLGGCASVLLTIGGFLAVASPALAQTDEKIAYNAPVREKTLVRNGVSPLVMASWAEGIGAGLQLDASILALRGSFAYAPIPAAIGETSERDEGRLDALHSYQANADLMLFFWAPTDHSRIGLSGGYRYNDVLGHGGSWGLQVEADVAKHAAIFVSLSTSYFPDGESRALDALGNPDEAVSFPFGARFLTGVGVGFRFPI
jgi:hypothetical protein